MRFASVPSKLLLSAVLFAAAVAGCKKSQPSGEGAAPPPPAMLKFAFVTNNSSDFWNIAEKGLRKAEKDFGVKVDDVPAAQGRDRRTSSGSWKTSWCRSYDGVAISPINPDAMTEIFDKVACEDAARLPRLGRAEVQAQRLRRHQQRRGRARRRATPRSRP